MAQASATRAKKGTAAKKTTTAAKGMKKTAKTESQQDREVAAYFNWLNRGAPIGDDQHDWFNAK